MNSSNLNKVAKRTSTFFSFLGSFWIFLLMIIIVIDATGRVLFNSPLRGIPEIVKTSIPAISFLMIPWAINEDKFVRSTLIKNQVSQFFQKLIDIISYTIGSIIFIAIIIASWKQTVYAFKILEFEGEGALRVPTYPVRAIIIITCFFALWGCLLKLGSIFTSFTRFKKQK